MESQYRLPSKNYKTILLALIILNVITYSIYLFVTTGASRFGFTNSQIGNVSSRYEINITPAGATFSTWGAIYIWQALWLIFNVVIIFLKNEINRIYYDPIVLTISFHVIIFFHFTVSISWLFAWDAQKFTLSLFIIIFMLLTVYAAAFISHKNTVASEPYLKNPVWLIWLYRFFVNNGLAFYATWLTVATLLNLALAITFEWAPKQEIIQYKNTSSLISLSILLVVLISYFVLDMYFLEKYLRYTFSTYIQLCVAITGILSKNWNGGKESSSVFALLLGILIGIMFFTKIAMLVKTLKLDIRNYNKSYSRQNINYNK